MILEPTDEQVELMAATLAEQIDGGLWDTWHEDAKVSFRSDVRTIWPLVRDIVLEAAANKCKEMVIGGRAWTHDQEVASDALLSAAERILAMKGK